MKNSYNIFFSPSSFLENEEALRYVKDYQSGQKEAGEALVYYSLPMIQNIASQWVEKGNYDLDDLVQEGVIALLEYMLEFQPSNSMLIGASAFITVKQAIGSYCKQIKQQKAYDDKYIIMTDFCPRDIYNLLSDKVGNIQLEYEEREMKNIIWQTIKKLPDMDRIFLELWIGVDGKPYTLREIGKMFNISRTAVNNRLIDVLNILRNKLKRTDALEIEPSKIKTDKQKRKLKNLK